MASGEPVNPPAAEPIPFPDLVALLQAIFRRHGTSPHVAEILAHNCAMCERDGARSHGIFRVPGYIASLATGWVDGKALPRVEDVAPGFCRVDAMNGFAQPALAAARALFAAKIRANGVAILAIRNSHHLSALWPDIEPFANEGLMALSLINSFACTVPFGARQAVFGTNPMAFAAPRAGGPPIVFDMATSAMANGDVQIAAQTGRALPPEAGVDAAGNPTTDPNAVLEGGALLPFGGHKGSALSMMIELMCAGLTGGKFSFEVDWSGHPGAQTPHTGQLLIGIDPGMAGGAAFDWRAQALVARMHEAGLSHVPGERRAALRATAHHDTLSLPPGELARLRQLRDAH